MTRPFLHKRAARAVAVSVITFVVALTAIWAAPRVSDAVAAWVTTPAVRLTSFTVGALPVQRSPEATRAAATQAAPSTGDPGLRSSVAPSPVPSPAATTGVSAASPGAVTVDAGMSFTMVGLTCRPPDRQGPVLVRLRASADGDSWGQWYEATLDRTGRSDGTAPLAFTEPVWTGAGRYVQVCAVDAGGARAAPLELRGVAVVAINSTEDADRGAVVVGVVRRTIATVAGITVDPAAAEAMTTKPTIVTRSQWGANESYRTGSPDFAPVKMVFVHHTDSGNSYSRSEARAVVRGVYAYHTKSLHWSDIGYNFLVDRYGVVYEGRYGGVTQGPIGAQTLGFNTGSCGISVIGTFSNVSPPRAALSSLKKLIAWKLDIHHVNPLGSAVLTCGYGQKFSTGQRVRFRVVSGHRDANYTDCPGTKLYGLLPAVRRDAAAMGQPKIYGYHISSNAISPDGDSVRDSLTVRFTVAQSAAWKIEVHDAGGAVVWRKSGTGTGAQATWAGKDNQGRKVPDGSYSLVASASNSRGTARPARSGVLVDTTAPKLQSADVQPDPFSPNADGHSDKTWVRFQPGESGTVRVSVYTSGGTLLRRLADWRSVSSKTVAIRWDGRVRSGGRLVAGAEGHVTVKVEMRDRAGNQATASRTVALDRTLGFPAVSPATCSPNGDGVKDKAAFKFKLTRRADVTVTLMQAGSAVRTLHAGALAAGARSVAWNGRLGSGAAATSGAYSARVTAVSAIGAVSVSQPFMVDVYAPRLTAPATARVTLGHTAKLAYTVKDPYSRTVRVTVNARTTGGKGVATLRLGWVRSGRTQTCSWKPPRRGVFILTFTAVDHGGNRQRTPVKTTLTVL